MGGIVSSIFGGGGGGSTTNNYTANSYQPANQASADQTWQALLASLQASNPYPALIPQYNQVSGQVATNPYATGAQNAANTAGATAGAVGNNLAGLSGIYSGEAAALTPYIGQVLNLGTDPQLALYNQQLQKNTDQANVANAQYGLTGQQAAGNLNQDLTNFNIDWQSQQLARALQGISGASTLSGTQTGLGSAAGTAGTGAATLQGEAGALPYGQYNSNIGNILNAIQGEGAFGSQNSAQITNAMNQALAYLGYGNQNTNAQANAAGVNATNTALAGQGLAGLFGSLGGLGQLFGSTAGGLSGSNLAGGATTLAGANAGTAGGIDFANAIPAATTSSAASGAGDIFSLIGSLF